MRYFDSPKNRALWEKELKTLRQERDRREKNGFKPVVSQKQAEHITNQFRKRISFKELELKEFGTGKVKSKTAAIYRQTGRSNDKTAELAKNKEHSKPAVGMSL